MKKIFLIILFLAIFSVYTICETEPEVSPEITVGNVYFPRPFVHSGKDFSRGVYKVLLVKKEGVPFFKISDKKGNYLFDEMAVVKPYNPKYKKFKYRIKKEMLRGYEYFRIKITKPDKLIMGYFLLKNRIGKKVKNQNEQAAR